MLKSRYTMIGGFLGAGKTTALLQIAKRLQEQGKRVGLITNDQSIGLVDTAMLDANGLRTEEISGGCFCCKFNSLMEAASRLTNDMQPDVFLAEPVGSCTDLQATVTYPMRKIYGDKYVVSPLSVMVDPIRAQRILGLKPGKTFSPKVNYIYNKQLEEADLIVINKCDLLDDEALTQFEATLRETYPLADILRVSARNCEGIDAWIERLMADEADIRSSLDIDYDIYAAGEAELGWLNVTVNLDGPAFDGNALIQSLIQGIGERLQSQAIEVAHLKATLTPSEGADLAVANLVRDDAAVELSHALVEPLEQGELIINLRAEGDPVILKQETLASLESLAASHRISVVVQHAEAFRPSPPTPTHRITTG